MPCTQQRGGAAGILGKLTALSLASMRLSAFGHPQPTPGPLHPSMFHVSRCCSPTIAIVEAAQFERSCTKQLIIHQSGSNAQVPLLDHVSVSVSHTAVQPFNPQGQDMAPRPVGPSPADRLCTCKDCSRLLTGHGSKGLGLELEIEPSRPRARAGVLHRASAGHQEGRVKRQTQGVAHQPLVV